MGEAEEGRATLHSAPNLAGDGDKWGWKHVSGEKIHTIFEVCPPGSQATLKINKAFEAGSSESRLDTCLGLL